MRKAFYLLLMAVACRGGEAAPDDSAGGRLEVDGEPGGRMVDAAARGLACARDTTVAIVGIGEEWAAAISMRTLLPSGGSELRIRIAHDSIGGAMLALRALGDTMFSITADSGLLRLAEGDSLAGTFEAHAGRDSTLRRLSGRFAVPMPPDSCP